MNTLALAATLLQQRQIDPTAYVAVLEPPLWESNGFSDLEIAAHRAWVSIEGDFLHVHIEQELRVYGEARSGVCATGWSMQNGAWVDQIRAAFDGETLERAAGTANSSSSAPSGGGDQSIGTAVETYTIPLRSGWHRFEWSARVPLGTASDGSALVALNIPKAKLATFVLDYPRGLIEKPLELIPEFGWTVGATVASLELENPEEQPILVRFDPYRKL